MTTLHQTSGRAQLPPAPAASGGQPLTLADEHALLLQQVAVRADDVLTVAGLGQWPATELQRLVGYLRAEVLRQAEDEEMLLFTARAASPGLARLGRDHARQRAATEVLERAAAGGGTWSPARLAAVTRDLVCQLERHFAAEERLLTTGGAPGQVPAITSLGGHPHEWYPLTEGPVIDLDALPPGQMTDAAAERLLQLRQGEQVELRSGRDPWPVWRRMDRLSPGSYGFAYTEDGPGRWRVQVTRRPVGEQEPPARGRPGRGSAQSSGQPPAEQARPLEPATGAEPWVSPPRTSRPAA